jgi:hypothetical protein
MHDTASVVVLILTNPQMIQQEQKGLPSIRNPKEIVFHRHCVGYISNGNRAYRTVGGLDYRNLVSESVTAQMRHVQFSVVLENFLGPSTTAMLAVTELVARLITAT